MWLDRNPWPMDTKYDFGGEFLGQEFKNNLILDGYRIEDELETMGTPISKYITKIINMVLGYVIRTLEIDKDNDIDDD